MSREADRLRAWRRILAPVERLKEDLGLGWGIVLLALEGRGRGAEGHAPLLEQKQNSAVKEERQGRL